MLIFFEGPTKLYDIVYESVLVGKQETDILKDWNKAQTTSLHFDANTNGFCFDEAIFYNAIESFNE